MKVKINMGQYHVIMHYYKKIRELRKGEGLTEQEKIDILSFDSDIEIAAYLTKILFNLIEGDDVENPVKS